MNLEWKRSPYFGESVDQVMEKKTGKKLRELNTFKKQIIKNIKDMVDVLLKIKDDLKTVYLLGDYDADGVTSCLIMSLLFNAIGVLYEVYIPRRISDGYGVSENSLKQADKHSVIITIDNGITAKELLDKSDKEVYIIDHHLLRDDGLLPDAKLIIDPEIGTPNGFTHYCAAGLAYKIAEEFYERKLVDNESMRKITLLASIGTIADVVPLADENRMIVRNGLYLLNKGAFPQFTQKFGLSNITSAADIAFNVAPVLNACGRLLDAGGQRAYTQLYNFFANNNIAGLNELISINQKRKAMQNYIFEDAWEQYIKCPPMYPNIMLIPNCPEGLIGIIAGKIQEKTKKTTIVFTITANGNLKGSARGDDYMNVKLFLDKHKEIFLKYGGHKSAAGMSMTKDNFDKLLKFAQENAPNAPKCYEYYDLMKDFDELPSLLSSLERWEPFGEGCKQPVIRTKISCRPDKNCSWFNRMGEGRTVQLYSSNPQIDVMGFNMLKQYEAMKCPKEIEALGTFSRDFFQGRQRFVFKLIDFCSL